MPDMINFQVTSYSGPPSKFTHDEQDAVDRWKAMLDYKHSPDVAGLILSRVNELTGQTLQLKFLRWYEGDMLYAISGRGTTHVLLGSWWGHRYVLRGLLKVKAGARNHTFLCNGQAGKNTSQVAFWHETQDVEFPEMKQIEDAFQAAMAALGSRTAKARTELEPQGTAHESA